MNIEVYSVKGFSGSLLKSKLEAALEKNRLIYSVSLINNVDQFIEAGLSSVPALKIGNKIIEHPSDQAFDDMVQKAVDFILEEKINSILVPVDFSQESIHGLHYAKMMAGSLGLGITIVHVHYPIYDPVSSVALNVHLVRQNENQLDALAAKLMEADPHDGFHVHVSTHVEEGAIAGSLTDLLENEKYEMMIMGTKGIDSGVRRLFGSISSAVSRHSHKPVIVVPPHAELKFPGKIVIGFAEELVLNNTLEFILSFGEKNHVFFDFVHISDDQKGFRKLKDKLYEKLMTKRDLLCGFNIRPVSGQQQQIHEVLFEYARDVHAGMILLVTKHRNFIESLRHKSVTKKALQQTTIPLMIVHPIHELVETGQREKSNYQ